MNSPQNYLATPTAMFKSSWRYRELIWQMTKREIAGRYRGSVIGLAWSFFNPVLMLLIYTFVFSVVFKARWGVGVEESETSFAIILFVGMIVHGFFAECINRAPGLIVSNVNYVKKVVFPLEILPWVALGSALFHSLVSLTVLLLFQVIYFRFVPWTSVFFPLLLLPLILGCMGLTWFLAALGVYMRDINQITSIFITILLFLSPVFFPISALPKNYQTWMYLNPLTFFIEESRNLLLFGNLPNWTSLFIVLFLSIIIATSGFWWFQKTRKGFADVL